MGVNWLAGLHHPDGPGRRRAMPSSRRGTGGRGRQLQGGRQTAVILGQIRQGRWHCPGAGQGGL